MKIRGIPGMITKPSISLYGNRSNFKWIVLTASVVISASSLVYTDILVKKIRERERKQVDLYANTLQYMANEDDAPNLIFVLEKIIQANNTVPVILTDETGHPENYRNLSKADGIDDAHRNAYLLREVSEMRSQHAPIVVILKDDQGNVYGRKYIYYKDSKLLTQLRFFPYVQLSIIGVFGLIIYAVFNYSKRAEQNRVWVGMAKETAHQLGTPLSSLMAWTEYFKETFPDHMDIFDELQKDVDRLQMITERFSNIGSIPQMKEENVVYLVQEVMDYLRTRISKKVSMNFEFHPNDDISFSLNRPLFAWVIENLIKNAVDAMNGVGSLHVRIMKVNHGQIALDISDTGKGIPKHKFGQVFKPGYTTKQRGWGLGLALVKRIVENYHGGRIFVKSSEIGKGTVFRVLLKI